MRWFMLIVILMAAAFIGGAILNSVNPTWGRSWLLRNLGLKDRGEISSIDLPPLSSTPTSGPGEGRNPTGISSLPKSLQEPSLPPSQRQPLKKKVSSGGIQPPSRPGSVPKPQGDLTSSVDQASKTSPPNVPAPTLPMANDKAQQISPLQTTDPLASSPKVDSSLQSATSLRDSENGTGHIGELNPDWGTLRQKLQVLGVKQYVIKGSPAGEATIIVSVPLAGQQAKLENLEVVGVNEFEAVRKAIRRITLLQASAPRPGSTPLK